MRLLRVFENPKTPYVNSNILENVELSFCSNSFSKSKHECTLYRVVVVKTASLACLSLRPSTPAVGPISPSLTNTNGVVALGMDQCFQFVQFVSYPVCAGAQAFQMCS